MSLPVIAIFDIGKTNKKLLLFDEQYHIVLERSARFAEIADEDGDPCENLESLRTSVFDSLREVLHNKEFDVRALNFSTYGASFVCINDVGQPVAPLYNYLKEYPEQLKQQFYAAYGGESLFSSKTASPVLGSLNSGMQLYRMKYQKPELFAQTKYALHLPQYMSYILSGHACSDITSIGCHTNLWDYQKGTYHEWVMKEGIAEKLAPIKPSDAVVSALFSGKHLKSGIGLHDSSAALIPYLLHFQEPFILISTGTWCISLNPFNNKPLSVEELHQDCLCYLTYKGEPVKAARVFSGYEHEQQIKRIEEHFHVDAAFFRTLQFDTYVYAGLERKESMPPAADNERKVLKESLFARRDLSLYANAAEAYHQLIADLVKLQYASTTLVLQGSPVKRIFVDGGFSKNNIYMNLLAAAFPNMEVYAASVAQATAMGAALVLHQHWSRGSIPSNLIDLEYYRTVPNLVVS